MSLAWPLCAPGDEKACQELCHGLTQGQLDTLWIYATHGSHPINHGLRYGLTHKNIHFQKLLQVYEHHAQKMLQFPSIKVRETFLAWRAMDMSWIGDSIQVGTTWTDTGFSSVSLSDDHAKRAPKTRRNCTLMRLHIHPGCCYIPMSMANIHHGKTTGKGYGFEHEITLMPGHHFYVHEIVDDLLHVTVSPSKSTIQASANLADKKLVDKSP